MGENPCDMTAIPDEPGDELADWRLYDVNQAQLCHFLRAVSIGDDSTTGHEKAGEDSWSVIVIGCRQREQRHSRKSSVAF